MAPAMDPGRGGRERAAAAARARPCACKCVFVWMCRGVWVFDSTGHDPDLPAFLPPCLDPIPDDAMKNSTAALKEQQRLLACGERLEAKGAIRWGPAFESGAILCEALCQDQLALAGAGDRPVLGRGWMIYVTGGGGEVRPARAHSLSFPHAIQQ